MQKLIEKICLFPFPFIRRISVMATAAMTWLYASAALAFQEPQPQNLSGITRLVGTIATWLGGIAGAVFVILFIIKGIKLASSSGNPHGKADAISGLMWTGIGAIVAFSAAYLVGVAMGIGANPGNIVVQ